MTWQLIARKVFRLASVDLAPAHNTRVEAYLGYAYAAAGRTDDARSVLKELEAHRREQYVSYFGSALIHDSLAAGLRVTCQLAAGKEFTREADSRCER